MSRAHPYLFFVCLVFGAQLDERVARADPPPGAHEAPHESAGAFDDWSFIPIIFYTPETQFGFGAAAIYSFNASDNGSAPLSTLGGGVIVTSQGQVMVKVEPDIRFDDVLVQGTVRFQRFPTRFFRDGALMGDEGEPFDELSLITHIDIRYRLGAVDSPLADLSAGLRCDVRWNRVTEVVADGAFEGRDPLGLTPWVGMGCGPVLAWDTRDDVRYPTRGLYAQARLAGFFALYGESFTAFMTDIDVRHYADLGAHHVLATQLALRSTVGDLPYQLWPRLGGPNLHRGWFDGHLRGRHTLLLQVEWRFPVVWKIGATVFGSVGQAFDRFDELSPSALRFAGGAGLRFLLNKRQNVNLRLDLAWGNGFAVYVDVLEAF